MPAIKSLEELKRIREEALQKKQMKATPGNIQALDIAIRQMSCRMASTGSFRGIHFPPGSCHQQHQQSAGG